MLLLLSILITLPSMLLCDDLVVATTSGAVRGRTLHLDADQKGVARAFHGIPYARPPIGNHRFQKATPVAPWDGVLDCTSLAPECPQDYDARKHNPFMSKLFEALTSNDTTDPPTWSEDCLTLDIYAPPLPTIGSVPHAVMVWLHGGGFYTGGVKRLDARALAISHNVVVICVQYRIGVLGFLYLGDDEQVDVNMGLTDQTLALKWIQKNIGVFGGDRDRITLFGQSAGAYSASYHLLHEDSNRLFSRVILQSGSMAHFYHWISPAVARNMALMQARILNCSNATAHSMLTCFRSKQVSELIVRPAGYHKYQLFFPPVLDGTVLSADPDQVLGSGSFNTSVQAIVGVTDIEGVMIAASMGRDFTSEKAVLSLDEFNNLVEIMLINFWNRKGTDLGMRMNTSTHAEKSVINLAKKAILDFYVHDRENGTDLINLGFVDMLGDMLILSPTYGTLRQLSRHSTTYGYVYTYKRKASRLPSYMTADHNDDILTAFGYSEFSELNPFVKDNSYFSKEDSQFSTIHMRYWTNFAKTGDPNGAGLPSWEKFGVTERYLELGRQPVMKHAAAHADRFQFWNVRMRGILQLEDSFKDEL